MICRLPSPKVPNVPFLLRGSRREEKVMVGRREEKVMVGLQCTARKKRERNGRQEERERRMMTGAADFYSWAEPSIDGRDGDVRARRSFAEGLGSFLPT
jgi:hypothetical protein